MSTYFSERDKGALPSSGEELSAAAWRGILGHIERRLNDCSFGHAFPEQCHDGSAICGCDRKAFWDTALGENSELSKIFNKWGHIDGNVVPPAHVAMDFVEFCVRHVAKPTHVSYHSFFKHHHFAFDQEAGQKAFIEDIRTVLKRNGLAFQIDDNGAVHRIGPEIVGVLLTQAVFRSEDALLNDLLTGARKRFLDPDPAERQIGLEGLWDAFERLKTLEPGGDKKARIKVLLDRAASGPLRDALETESIALTQIGNAFRIRHSETGKTPVDSRQELDYLFSRLFIFLQFIMRQTGRGG